MPYIVGEVGIGSLFEDNSPYLGGNLNLNSKNIIGTGSLNLLGIITATTFVGDGSNLTGVSTFSGDYNNLTNKPSIPSIVGLASEGYVDSKVAISTSGLLNSSGNGSNLTGIVTFITAGSGISIDQSTGNVTITATGGGGSVLGIATAGGIVGTGVTLLDFRGAGISTITVSSGTATINIEGGGGSSTPDISPVMMSMIF